MRPTRPLTAEVAELCGRLKALGFFNWIQT
jgi:hypothetical protein